jgi:hypothetical protein
MEGGPPHAALRALLPALSGASRLRRLDLSDAARLPEDQQLALPALAVLGATQLTELVLEGCPAGAFGVGALLAGLTSLRRLDVSSPGGLGGGSSSGSGSGFDDAALAALAACRLPLLQELDATGTAVEGLFAGWSGGSDGGGDGGSAGSGGGGDGGGGNASGEEPPPSPWGTLRGLRSLKLAGSGLVSKPTVLALAAALGGDVTSLSLGRAEGGRGLAPPALAALCARMPALRRLQLVGGDLAPRDLEAHLPRLPRLERAALEALNPLICDAPRLAALARRLPRARLSVNGVAVGVAGPPGGGGGSGRAGGQQQAGPVAAAPKRGCSSSGGGGGGGGPHAGAPGAARASIDQRYIYSASLLRSLQASPAVARGSAAVRAALLGEDDDGSGIRRSSEILRPDW